ncbi:MAG TPA: hypothetical protein VLC94_05585 [Candidatus Acidoferrum sp.]|nr:hypothetical protein [Candidatus Acidoferrum sp.]
MRNWSKFLLAASAAILFVGFASADTLELKDGRVIQGRYLGGTQAVLRFEVNGEVQTFPTNDIVALTFTRNSGSAPAPAPPSAPVAQLAPSNPPPSSSSYSSNSNPGADVSVPAGQPLLVRMIDSVDSSKNHVGDIFHASLETDLNVNGVLVARKGTDVYGRLASSEKSGNFSGKSELQLELTRLVVDGRDYPLVSSDYNVQGKSQGSSAAKKVGGGAVAGAIIGAIAGGGKGAAIGAAAGGGAGAGVQILTKGQQVKVPSETLLEFRLQQSVIITPSAS